MTPPFPRLEKAAPLPEVEGPGTCEGVLLLERLGRTSFGNAHRRMLDLQRRLASEPTESLEHLILFEPDKTVTLGSASQEAALLLSRRELEKRDVSVRKVDRGGEATYHGPGQVVGYLLLRLGEEERDLHLLPRAIEESLIEVLSQLGIDGHREKGRTGVWVEDRKIASIGISVRRWVSGHGFALIVEGDLTPFEWIIPCGIRGCPVTSIERELAEVPDREWIEEEIARELARRFSRELKR